MNGSDSEGFPTTQRRAFARFVVFYCKTTGWRLGLTVALRSFQAATQGFGLIIVIPVLGALGYLPNSSANASLTPFLNFLENALPEPKLVSALGIFLAISAIIEGARYVETRVQASIEQDFILRLRQSIFEAYLSSSWVSLVQSRGSDISHLLTVDASRVAGTARQSLRCLFGLIMVMVYVGAALVIQPQFSLIVLLAGTPLLWLLRLRNPRFYRAGHKQRERLRQFFSLIQENTQGLKLIKSLNLENSIKEESSKIMNEIREDQLYINRLTAFSTFLYKIGAAVVVTLFLLIGLQWLQIEAPVMVMLVVVFARLYPQMAGVIKDWQATLPGMSSFKAYQQTLEDLRENAELKERSPTQHRKIRLNHSIQLKEVNFHYEGATSHPALDNITLQIEAGQTIALVGPSGAGKTTLGDLLLGLIPPQSGTIAIDGNPLAGEHLSAWRQNVSYVPQETYLFNQTIAWNLRWTSPESTDEELWTALRKAAAADFVGQLPEKLNTMVGDRGHLLSGGERQRIALARALLRKPIFLVLDEATSALDAENEARLQQAIQELHSEITVCVIAHRLSTVRTADKIYVLESGRIIEAGNWDNLASGDGWFARSIHPAQSN